MSSRATGNSAAEYLPCQWCGDPGEEARAVVINTDTREERSEPIEFIACEPCLRRFAREELGWPA